MIMELLEDDKLASAESQSIRSSQSLIDTPNDLMRIVEENYQRFNDIVNLSAPVENNLDKELAKEDKRCTFLQYKIENLSQRYKDATEISATLQKSVRDQQMEIEKVSAVIYEQLKQLNEKFPPDGLSHYSNAVSVISNAGDWVKNLKNILQYDIEECAKKTAKLLQKQQGVGLLRSRIQKLIAEKTELELILKFRIRSVTKPDFESFKIHLSLLSEKFYEYQSLKREDNMKKVELEELKKKKIDAFNECQKINQTSIESLNKYNEINASFRKQCDQIKNEQVEFENLYDQMMKEFNSMLTHLTQQIEILDDHIFARKQELDKTVTRKETDKSEYNEKLSQIEQLKLEYSKTEKYITSCRQEEEMSGSMKQSIIEQINILKTTIVHSKSLQEELAQKVGDLQLEYNSSNIGLENSSVENLQEKINQEQTEVERNLINSQILNGEISELNEVILKSTNSNNKLRSDLNLCQTECNFHKLFLEKSEIEYNETRKKQVAAVHEGVNKSLKDITNAYCSTFEKQLMIDSLQVDIHEYTKLLSKLQQKVWAANYKNETLRSEMAQLQNVFSRENEAVESKKKLLEDLEKNSFPKNKIPVNWFKSFEKQKQEYDSLVKQRLELEKQRNKLIIEIDSQTFQDNKSESADAFESAKSSSIKNAMYDMFKERVRKKKAGSLRS